jgi:hypothetical protein
MNTGENQQQKDFISSMFPQDSSATSLPNMSSDQSFYNGQSTFQNVHNTQDIVENLMNLSSQNLASNFSLQGPGTRQVLLEQQLKIQQLQQLQLLQQQIFQQQVSYPSLRRSTL